LTVNESLQEKLAIAREAAIKGNYAQSEHLLRQVLDANPSELEALDLMGFVLFFQGEPGEAAEMCLSALRLDPEHAYAMKGLGLCLSRLGDVDSGIAWLVRAISKQPDWFDPRWDLAVVLIDNGRRPEAVAVLKAAVAALPQERDRFSPLLELALSAPADSGP
jgi:tetratricopeptide (TPR) repeat protein